jgi:MFS transporter, Spinster family, sphingosine-1-phosphate transporter
MTTTVGADPRAVPGLAPGVTSRQANLTLGMLTVIYVFNFVDRQILNILAEPIAKDLNLSDTQIGLMTGLAFAAFYTVMGIPLARYADHPKSNRIGLMSICLAVWSGMTALSGLAQNYAQLLLARIGVGAGEAGCTPAAVAVIADIYPPKRRASALGIYMMGVPIGSLFGLVLGGQLSDLFGWRTAFMVVGIPGVILAVLLFLFVREPRRMPGVSLAARTEGGEAPLPFMDVMRELFSSRAFVLLLTANSIGAFLAYGKGVWQIIFFIRSFGLSAGEVGLMLGLTGGICGLIGSAIGGRIADWLGSRDPGNYFLAPAVGNLISVPLLFLAYSSNQWWMALLLMIVPFITGTMNYGAGMASTQGLFRPQARSMATAVKLFIQTLIGLGLGPLFFGMISDALKPVAGAESVRWVLISAAFLGLVPAVALWFASRRLRVEMRYGLN